MFIGGSRLGFRFRYPGGEPGLPQYPNGGFEEGLTEWTMVNNRFFFNSSGRSPTVINGIAAPANPNPNPYGSPGDVYGNNSQNYNGRIAAHSSFGNPPPDGGVNCVALSSFAQQGGEGGSLYGPYFYSNNAIYAGTGDTIEFYWRAFSSSNPQENDAFSVRSYAFTKSGNIIFLLNNSAPSPGTTTSWAKAERTIAAGEEGAYYFVFVCGSWDATYGTVVGSSLLVDNVKMRKVIFSGD